jgi:hypothetical protein
MSSLIRADRDRAPDTGAGWAAICLNCREPLTGQFCSHCGQRAVPPHPTVRELAGDTYNELVGWDGKFAATLRLFVTRPGELTRAWLDGQRALYISPVRLYLMCSLVYFLLAAAAPPPSLDASFDVGIGVGAPGEQTPGQAAMIKAISSGMAVLSPVERTALEGEVAKAPSPLRPVLRALATDYRGTMGKVTEAMPRALFVLMPALAGILALFYPGRHYPDHLYFSIHFQTFAFLALTLVTAAQFARSVLIIGVVQLVAYVGMVVYGLIAQRRVYGGTWLAAALKSVGVGLLYLMLWSLATITVTLWAVRGT